MQPVVIVAAASVVSLGVGAYAGYYLAHKRISEEYDLRLQEELAKSKEFYTKLSKRGDYADPAALLVVDKYERLVEEYVAPEEKPEPVEVEEPDEPEEKVVQFDYRREIPKRANKKAYVISQEEFAENPKDYDQRTITYFEKDDVLADERDVPIDDVRLLLGEEALDQFGNGSHDPNIVYVRNDFASMDLEVLLSPDSYEETVVGVIKHSDRGRPRKFRIDDH